MHIVSFSDNSSTLKNVEDSRFVHIAYLLGQKIILTVNLFDRLINCHHVLFYRLAFANPLDYNFTETQKETILPVK